MTAAALRRIGSWAFIVVGAGHLVAHLAAPMSPERLRVIDAMRQFVIDMPGRRGTLYEYHEGFSLMMGLLLVAYGVRTLLSQRRTRLDPREEIPLLAFDAVLSAVAAGLSAYQFFAVPLALTTLALLAYAGALAMTWREARWSK